MTYKNGRIWKLRRTCCRTCDEREGPYCKVVRKRIRRYLQNHECPLMKIEGFRISEDLKKGEKR